MFIKFMSRTNFINRHIARINHLIHDLKCEIKYINYELQRAKWFVFFVAGFFIYSSFNSQ